MKTSNLVIALLALGFMRTEADVASADQADLPAPTACQVVDRGANNQVWQRETYERAPGGQIVTHNHKYNELATGLNHLVNGQWVESKEEIDILPNGTGAATQGQHQAYFPGDIYNGVIEVVTPEGQHLQSRPLGLSYFDGTNSVLIAELKDSVGAVVGSNQVIYSDAFTDFKADLRYTYKKGGFEQDIVLRERPPRPESFGLDSQNTRLQVLTEFFDTSDPDQTAMAVNLRDGLQDTTLTFGSMRMVQGKAFSIGDSTRKTPSYKSWQHLEGRTFLVEELPVRKIETQLEQLPSPDVANAAVSSGNSARHKVSPTRLLTPLRLVEAGTNAMQVARADLDLKPGVVLDYVMINSSQTNFTFKGDTTYYISGNLNLLETTTIEGGAVIKYSTNAASIHVLGTVDCLTAPYRPAILTSKDDNAVGETISGSSGNPTLLSMAQYLVLSGYSSGYSISNLRFNYATYGVTVENPTEFWDCQFNQCYAGIFVIVGDCDAHNVLFNDCYCALEEGDGNFSGENVTMVTDYFFDPDGESTSWIYLTNSIIVTDQADNYTNQTVVHPSGTIFQKVGAGSYYLTNNSPYRNIGTTNISPALLADIRTKTTYPPIVYSNTTISVATTLSPQAQRDTDTPDLGYHYDPLDYCFGAVNANSDLTFTAGTAVGWFELSGSYYGILPSNNITVTFTGTATAPCAYVRFDTVQEGNGLWMDKSWLGGIAGGALDNHDQNHASVLRARFTRFSRLSGDPNNFRDGPAGEPLVIQLTDCEILGQVGGYNMLGGYTNCLFDRVDFWEGTGGSYPYAIFRNCTFHGGSFGITHWEEDAPYWYSSVRDCAFEGTTFSIDDPFGVNTNYADYDFNAYLTNAPQMSPQGPSNIVVGASFNWQSGWFGDYYLTNTSPLINGGDRTADQIGLYHFTTQTNQVKETNSIVDIGYHYVATDSNGSPIDTYWIGMPDYLADTNGSGAVGVWLMKYFGQLGVDPNADYDSDGTNNLQEYQSGTDPNKISFFFSLPNQYVTTNIVTGIITILGGVPSSIAILVDTNNFTGAFWTNYTGTNLTVDIGTTQGVHDVWIGLRGLPVDAQQTWQETTVVLDSMLPTISITNPVNNVSFNASRINVSGNFTAASLRQITVSGVLAFIDGTNFTALNVPLDPGTNTITAILEDFTGMTNAASIAVIGLTNSNGSMNDPVQLQATPVAGFAPLTVTFQITSNAAPGTFQQALYDFNGDGIADFATNNLNSFTCTYATNGEYFPVVTIQTTAGTFSSSGGWNSFDPNRLQVTVQATLMQTVFASVNDPVDLKWSGTNLYVLSGSDKTLTEFNTNASTCRTLSLGASASGFDVDGAGNVYVALTSSNQVWKFFPTNSSFAADTNFGFGGRIGLTNGVSGTTNGAFNAPYDVAVSPDGGTVSVSDSGNNRIEQFLATNGVFVAMFGTNGADVGQFNSPKGLTYDSKDTLYIADSGNNRIVLAQDSGVVGVTGTNGTLLEEFSGPVNISVGERGVYVADTSNNRIQSFNLLANGIYSFAPSGIRFAVSTNLNQPAAVTAVGSLINETFYVADTGNNRVMRYTLVADDPTSVWTNMTAHVAVGDISGAVLNFSSLSANKYRQAFITIGIPNSISAINQIGTLTPVFIDNDTAEYYFQKTIEGQTITFPIEFIKENGGWKIDSF